MNTAYMQHSPEMLLPVFLRHKAVKFDLNSVFGLLCTICMIQKSYRMARGEHHSHKMKPNSSSAKRNALLIFAKFEIRRDSPIRYTC